MTGTKSFLLDAEEIPPIDPSDEITLGDGGVDLWCCHTAAVNDAELLATYAAWMTPDERERYQRFLFARHQQEFLVTRALCRWVLSRYAPIAPEAWRFEAGSHGKLRVANEGIRLWFNLSHTGGLVACAVSATCEQIGVDVESVDRKTDVFAIAKRFFSPRELERLRVVAEEHRRERFFCYWTLKESYTKARGLGLSLPLEQFSFELDNGPRIGVSFAPELGDDPNRWSFVLVRPSVRHRLAVAAAIGPGTNLTLRYASCIPLRGVVSPG